MAAGIKTKAYTIPGASNYSLTTILGLTNERFNSNALLRADTDNVGRILIKDSAGEQGGFLDPGDALSLDVSGHYFGSSQLLISGTTGDRLYVLLVD